YTIEKEDPREVLILAGDHIYKMNYAEMIRFHRQNEADLTVGCIKVPLSECRHFGVMRLDEKNHITAFIEKPAVTDPLPDDPQHCLASMGIYVFSAKLMFELLCEDAARNDSDHDFGKNVIPTMIGHCRVFGYPFPDLNKKPVPYWRDVGTLDAYYQATMDLVGV